jgi:hypothetical protein
MVDAVSETRIEPQTTMMNRGFKTLVLGSMKMFKFTKILTVATIVMAMAATTFGAGTDMDGYIAINAASGTADVNNPRLGQGSLTTLDILDGGILNAVSDGDKMRLGEKSRAIINVQVGGIMNAVVETDDYFGHESELNVYGTAFIEQLRIYGNGNHNGSPVGTTSTILVDGTLTVKEGLIGKKGIIEMTITTNGTFIVEGYASAGSRFSIDSEVYSDPTEGVWDHGGYASFLNIVGNGRMLLKSGDSLRAGHGNAIQGNGVLNNFVITPGTGADVGYNVYTAVPEPATMSLLAIGGLALLRRKRRRA